MEQTLIKHTFKCNICGKETYLHQNEKDEHRAVTYPMSDEWEKINGQVNVAIKLDCGHFMLDDKEEKCPDFVENIGYEDGLFNS